MLNLHRVVGRLVDEDLLVQTDQRLPNMNPQLPMRRLTIGTVTIGTVRQDRMRDCLKATASRRLPQGLTARTDMAIVPRLPLVCTPVGCTTTTRCDRNGAFQTRGRAF